MEDLKLTSLITESQIQKRVIELGKEISKKYKGQDLTVVCVLKGSIMFFSDLVRSLEIDVKCEFIGVSSYGDSMSSTGEVKLTMDLTNPAKGKNILIVEDIVDTGLTMKFLKETLQARQPKSIAIASLLLKPDSLKTECKVDFLGFEIGNDFVVGYGLDYQGFYRNIPYVAKLNMN